MAKLPGINYNRRVQSLGRHDVRGPGTVAMAQARATQAQGRAAAAQIMAQSDIAGYEMMTQHSIEQAKLEHKGFELQMKRQNQVNEWNFINAALDVAQVISQQRIDREIDDGARIYHEKTATGLATLEQNRYRTEQSGNPHVDPVQVSNHDVLVSNYEDMERQAREAALARVKNPEARARLIESFDNEVAQTRPKVFEQSLRWKQQDDRMHFNINLDSQVRAGNYAMAEDSIARGLANGTINIQEAHEARVGVRTQQEQMALQTQIDGLMDMGKLAPVKAIEMHERLDDRTEFAYMTDAQRKKAHAMVDEQMRDYWLTIALGKANAYGPDNPEGYTNIASLHNQIKQLGPEAAGFSDMDNFLRTLNTVGGMSGVTKSEHERMVRQQWLEARSETIINNDGDVNLLSKDIPQKDKREILETVHGQLSEQGVPLSVKAETYARAGMAPQAMKNELMVLARSTDPEQILAASAFFEDMKQINPAMAGKLKEDTLSKNEKAVMTFVEHNALMYANDREGLAERVSRLRDSQQDPMRGLKLSSIPEKDELKDMVITMVEEELNPQFDVEDVIDANPEMMSMIQYHIQNSALTGIPEVDVRQGVESFMANTKIDRNGQIHAGILGIDVFGAPLMNGGLSAAAADHFDTTVESAGYEPEDVGTFYAGKSGDGYPVYQFAHRNGQVLDLFIEDNPAKFAMNIKAEEENRTALRKIRYAEGQSNLERLNALAAESSFDFSVSMSEKLSPIAPTQAVTLMSEEMQWLEMNRRPIADLTYRDNEVVQAQKIDPSTQRVVNMELDAMIDHVSQYLQRMNTDRAAEFQKWASANKEAMRYTLLTNLKYDKSRPEREKLREEKEYLYKQTATPRSMIEQ